MDGGCARTAWVIGREKWNNCNESKLTQWRRTMRLLTNQKVDNRHKVPTLWKKRNADGELMLHDVRSALLKSLGADCLVRNPSVSVASVRS